MGCRGHTVFTNVNGTNKCSEETKEEIVQCLPRVPLDNYILHSWCRPLALKSASIGEHTSGIGTQMLMCNHTHTHTHPYSFWPFSSPDCINVIRSNRVTHPIKIPRLIICRGLSLSQRGPGVRLNRRLLRIMPCRLTYITRVDSWATVPRKCQCSQSEDLAHLNINCRSGWGLFSKNDVWIVAYKCDGKKGNGK